MDDKKFNDALRLASRMKRLITDAKKAGLQFVIIDGNVQIGDDKIADTWDSLIKEHRIDDFIPCRTYIAGIGA